MKKNILSFLFCVLFALSMFAQSSGPLDVKEYKLSNGLVVWLNEDHSQPKIVGAVVVKAGAKDCPDTGIAHYFEHMMFKGTDRIGTTNYPAEKILLDSIALKYDELAGKADLLQRQQIQKEINALSIRSAAYSIPNEFDRLISRYGGSGLNAATSYDFTVYYNEFSPHFIRQWAEVNSERLHNPVFRMFQSELETVYEEKNMYNDHIGGQAIEKVTERFFAPHPYAFSILGSTENLKNPRLSDMKKFFETYYVAGNMGLMLSGDFNAGEVLPILEETFSKIRKGEAPANNVKEPKPFGGKEDFVIRLPIPVVKILALGWRGVPANDKDEVKLRIMTGLLNNANKTGYLDKLSTDGQLMQAAAMSFSLNETGVLGVLVIPKLLVQSYAKAKKLAMDQVDRIKSGDFTDETFNSLKLEQKRNYETELENIDSRSQKMLSLFSQGKSWTEYLNEINEINAITKTDVVEMANKYFTGDYLEITKKTGTYPKDKLTKPGFAPIIPTNTEAKSEYAQELEKLKTAEAHPRFLDFEKDVQNLAPKVVLYTTANPVNDIFSLKLEYGKGTLESTLLSPLCTYLDLLGTDSLTYDQFRNSLQNIGSTLAFTADKDKFVMEISGFDMNFNQTLAVVSDFMKHAKADTKKMKQLVDEIKVNNKAEKESTDDMAKALQDEVRYGKQSEYLNRLSLAETKKLKGEDLIAEFRLVQKMECNMHYCGSLPAASVGDLIKKNLSVEEMNVASQTPVYRDLQPVNEPTVYFMDAPKSSQSIVASYLVGGVNNDRASRSAGALFNNYFGGSMSSLVFQQIREFRSLAYRARATYSLASYNHRDKEGQFSGELSTECDKTIDAMGVLDTLIRQMPAKAERVETACQDLVNAANNQYPSLRERSAKIALLKKQGFVSDPNIELIDAVREMDINHIVAFYDQNVKGRTIAYMVVGNSKKIDMQKLAAFGKIVLVKPGEVFK